MRDEELKAALERGLRAALGEKAENRPRSLPLRDLWARYWREFARHQKSAIDKLRIGKLLLRHLGDVPSLDITSERVEDYRDKRRRSATRLGDAPMPGTLNREVAVLRHCLNWAVRASILKYSPLAYVKMEEEENTRRTKIRSELELQAVLEELDPQMRVLVLLLIDCGLRRMEAITLRWRQVDWKKSVIELEKTKTGEQRRPRLSARVLEGFRFLKDRDRKLDNPFVFAARRSRDKGKHISPMTALRHLQAAVEAAGIEPAEGERFNLHALRHSFAYLRRVRDKIPERTVMLQGGWKTRSAFDRYGIGDDEETEEMYRVVDANTEAELSKLRK